MIEIGTDDYKIGIQRMRNGKEARKSIQMGHYCRICGRTRANEKFSGKGHKNHVCKDCSGKSSKKAKEHSFNVDTVTPEPMVRSHDVRTQSEDMYFDETWFSEIDIEKQYIEDEDDAELPF